MSKVVRLNDQCCIVLADIRKIEKSILDDVPKFYNPKPMSDSELISRALLCLLDNYKNLKRRTKE